MAAAAERAGIVDQVGLILRRSPAFGLVRELLADPAAGRPMTVVFRDDQFIPIRGLRLDVAGRARQGRRRHPARALDPRPRHADPSARRPATSVACRTATFHDLPGIEDVAVATIGFESGATASLTSVWHDVDERPRLRRVEVFCERAWICLEGDWSGPVRWRFAGDAGGDGARGRRPRRRGPRPRRSARQPGRLVPASRRDGRPAWPSLEDAVRAHELTDACYASAAAGGKPVPV